MVCPMNVPWLDMFRDALKSGNVRPIVLSLATVDSTGHPCVRSVICRRVDDDGSLWITTDSRSDKHAQLKVHPFAEALIWIERNREHFRFAGPVDVIDGSSLSRDRLDLWREMTPQSRAMFFWPNPGTPRAADDGASASTSEVLAPPETFLVLKLRPTRVDYLLLSTQPHTRLRWTFGEQWDREELNP